MKPTNLLGGLLAGVLTSTVHAERKPNVLLIVADDLGYGELTSQGFTKDIPTPNIDSIGANGVRFTSGYVSGPYCSPTRAGLLTGRYQQRFGHEFNPGPPVEGKEPVGLSLKETTIGDRLKSAGYATGWFGKSHLGSAPEYHPQKRGFDEFYGFLGGSHSYVTPRNDIFRGTEPVKDPGYLTEAFAREASAFIEKKKDVPWFVYLPFNAVHAPLETLEKYDKQFASITDPKRRKFAALLAALDDSVGTVLTKVRDLKLEEDTLIYFISDNGGPTPSITSQNGPLKGYKAQTSEGGIRVPFAVQWKGHLPAGKTDDRPVIQLDLLPTSLAAAGVAVDPAWKLDGVNLLPYLKGEKTESPHDALFWRFGEQLAVRKGDWKLVKSAADGTQGQGSATVDGAQLYNLASDVGEKTDLAAKEPAKVKELTELWNAWNVTLVAPKWTPNRNPNKGRNKGGARDAAASNATPVGPWKSGDVLSGQDSPDVSGKAFTIVADVDAATPPDGVIVAHGGAAHGYALHVTGGKLALTVRVGGEISSVIATDALPTGNHKVEATIGADSQVKLTVDGKPVGTGKLAGLIDRKPGEGLTVGNDGTNAVGDYTAPHAFSGKATNVVITAL
ncbi:MAG: sulfatase-like hydrolase/transferase [Verrucomicrobiota bacterium]